MTRAPEPVVVLIAADAATCAALAPVFAAHEMRAIGCRSGATAAQGISFHRPSVVLIDLAFDQGRGWEVLHEARRQGWLGTVVIAREPDAVTMRTAFAAGVDDVVAANADPAEIVARVLAVARRSRPDARARVVHRHRDLVLDAGAHEVRVAGRVVALTPVQFAILKALVEADGTALSRTQLIARTASADAEPPSERAIDLQVSRLRTRLGDDAAEPRYVEAVYGVGYRLATGDRDDGIVGDTAGALLEAMPDGVLLVDDALRVRAANAAALRLIGATRDGVIGRGCEDLLDCHSCAGAPIAGKACIGRAVLSGRSRLDGERAVVRRSDGAHLPVTFSHAAVAVEGGAPLLAVVIRADGASSPD